MLCVKNEHKKQEFFYWCRLQVKFFLGRSYDLPRSLASQQEIIAKNNEWNNFEMRSWFGGGLVNTLNGQQVTSFMAHGREGDGDKNKRITFFKPTHIFE